MHENKLGPTVWIEVLQEKRPGDLGEHQVDREPTMASWAALGSALPVGQGR